MPRTPGPNDLGATERRPAAPARYRCARMSARIATITVPLDSPLDIPGSLAGVGRWGDDLVDRWDGARWLRAWRVDDRWVPARARPVGTVEAPAVVLAAPESDLEAVAERLQAAFVTAPDALARLSGTDAPVAAAEAQFPGVRPVIQPDPFTALVRSISAQQINLRWAAEIRRRLAERFGARLELDGEAVYGLDPEPFAPASVEELRALQLTRAKSASVVAVATAALLGGLDRADLERLDDEAVVAHLTRLRGIGRWSAEWFLARTLGRPRVVAGDLGVRKAVGRAYLGATLPSEAEVRAATAHWGAAAGVAQQLLLHQLVEDASSSR